MPLLFIPNRLNLFFAWPFKVRVPVRRRKLSPNMRTCRSGLGLGFRPTPCAVCGVVLVDSNLSKRPSEVAKAPNFLLWFSGFPAIPREVTFSSTISTFSDKVLLDGIISTSNSLLLPLCLEMLPLKSLNFLPTFLSPFESPFFAIGLEALGFTRTFFVPMVHGFLGKGSFVKICTNPPRAARF